MQKIKIFSVIFIAVFLLYDSAFCEEDNHRDYLYSEAYFDYLIENSQEKLNEIKEKKEQEEILLDNNKEITKDEIVLDESIFKLHIQNDVETSLYRQNYEKINSKTVIPFGKNFNFMQDLSNTRNKYNSLDYKLTAGFEYHPYKFINIQTGIETNYRNLDQNPQSKKFYIVPQFFIGDKVSLVFPNKVNLINRSTDHDAGLKISPLKSKALDFGIYAGITKKQSGSITESINFSTDYYFF